MPGEGGENWEEGMINYAKTAATQSSVDARTQPSTTDHTLMRNRGLGRSSLFADHLDHDRQYGSDLDQ